MAKLKTAGIAMLTVWFLGGPAAGPATAAMTTASNAIEQFVMTLFNSF